MPIFPVQILVGDVSAPSIFLAGPVGRSLSSAMPEVGTTYVLPHPVVDQPNVRLLTPNTSVVFL